MGGRVGGVEAEEGHDLGLELETDDGTRGRRNIQGGFEIEQDGTVRGLEIGQPSL